jgi:hypothetical protein
MAETRVVKNIFESNPEGGRKMSVSSIRHTKDG